MPQSALGNVPRRLICDLTSLLRPFWFLVLSDHVVKIGHGALWGQSCALNEGIPDVISLGSVAMSGYIARTASTLAFPSAITFCPVAIALTVASRLLTCTGSLVASHTGGS